MVLKQISSEITLGVVHECQEVENSTGLHQTSWDLSVFLPAAWR